MNGATWQAKRTHCKNGHEFNDENTRLYRGYRLCRACVRLNASTKWRRENPMPFTRKHEQIAMTLPKTRQKRNRDRRHVELIAELKNRPCMDCGGSFPSVCMDFDHRDPSTKINGIAEMVRKGLDVLLAEVAKCDLVCANCHRIRSAKQRTPAGVPGFS